MFEVILAGFTGSFLSYFVAIEFGAFLQRCVYESDRQREERQTSNILFAIANLRKEVKDNLYLMKDQVLGEIKIWRNINPTTFNGDRLHMTR